MPADYRQYDYINKRVRYFDAQFLKDQDFIDEQKYHIDRQRRSLRYLHISGIVEGLTVKPGDGKNRDAKFQAAIAPGTALDQNGCQIVLMPSDPPETVALESYRNQTVEIFISYQEIESDMAQEGSKANRRWYEKPLITVIKVGDQAPPQGIRLSRLNVNSDGLVTSDRSDPTVRQYAGISLPSAGDAHPILRSAGEVASNLAILTGSLSISDNVGIGTQFPKDKLSIQGGALSFSDDNAIPQMGIDYDSKAKTLKVRSNRNAQGLNTDLLVISGTTGAVSIGTANTSGGLDINRGSTNDLALSVNSSGTGWGSGLQFKNTATNAKTYGIYSGSDGKWHFADVNSNSDRLVIDKDGNIGIGTTDPKAKLTAQTPNDYDGDTIRFEAKKEPTNYYLNLKAVVDSSRVRWVFDQKNAGTNYNSVLTFDRGNIGIGTAEPSAKLEVKLASATANTSLKLEHIGSNFIVRPLIAGGTSSVMENTGGGSLIINPNGGNVGIGTTDPQAKLRVSGGSLAIDYGVNGYLSVSPEANWPNGTHQLIGVEWTNSTDTVKLYTPGNNRKTPIMTLEANGNITMATSGTTANIDLTGHVQLKEYGTGNLAYLQARDDSSNREIGLQFRTQKGKNDLTEAMTIRPDGSLDLLQKPIEVVTYSNVKGDRATDYTTQDWICNIAGFASGRGDINENGAGNIIHVYAYRHPDGWWHVTADFRTHNDEHEDWNIVVMAIRKGIAKIR